FGIGDDGRRGASAFSVLDDTGFVTLKYRHTGVGGTEVNANNLSHCGVSKRVSGLLARYMVAPDGFSTPSDSGSCQPSCQLAPPLLATTTMAGRTRRPLSR